MFVTCIKEYRNKSIQVGESYTIIDADMGEYLIEVGDKEIWISKNDVEHFKYSV